MDGEEDIKAGLDLHEMAEILVEMGTWQALVRIHLLACLMVCVLHGHTVMFSLSLSLPLSHTHRTWMEVGAVCQCTRARSSVNPLVWTLISSANDQSPVSLASAMYSRHQV